MNYTDYWQFSVNRQEIVPSKKYGGWACGMYEGERVLARKLEGQTAVEYLGLDGKMILKWIFQIRMEGRGLNLPVEG
jgi:hypothetical protein